MSEPKLTQVAVTASVGGKVQIIKFDVSSDYFVSASRTYSIPDDWTNEQAEEFQATVLDEVRQFVDARGDDEYNARWDQCYLNRG